MDINHAGKHQSYHVIYCTGIAYNLLRKQTFYDANSPAEAKV